MAYVVKEDKDLL